jgi:hypothetical protein
MTFELDKLPTAIEAARVMLAATKPAADHLASLHWRQEDGYYTAIRRAAVCRQQEAVEAALLLIDAGKGECAAPLLRPACEELLWCTYLGTLDRQDAEIILICITHHEKWQSLTAQRDISSAEVMEGLALTPHLEQSLTDYPIIRSEFRRLGKQLGWPKRAIENGEKPSMAFIAKALGRKDFYDFLYSATSRYVHFSPFELLRRVWGTPSGKTSISSAHFHDYWAAFVLVYGVGLLADMLTLSAPEMVEHTVAPLRSNEYREAQRVFADFGWVPLVWGWEFTYFQELIDQLNAADKEKSK